MLVFSVLLVNVAFGAGKAGKKSLLFRFFLQIIVCNVLSCTKYFLVDISLEINNEAGFVSKRST